MAEEKFSLIKFFGSFFQILSWVKTFRFLIGGIIIVFAISATWKFFTKPQTQTQTQQMIVYPFSFSTVTYAPQQSQKQEIKKRLWWLPYVFGEVYGFAEKSGIDSQRTGLGTRGGLRWEW